MCWLCFTAILSLCAPSKHQHAVSLKAMDGILATLASTKLPEISSLGMNPIVAVCVFTVAVVIIAYVRHVLLSMATSSDAHNESGDGSSWFGTPQRKLDFSNEGVGGAGAPRGSDRYEGGEIGPGVPVSPRTKAAKATLSNFSLTDTPPVATPDERTPLMSQTSEPRMAPAPASSLTRSARRSTTLGGSAGRRRFSSRSKTSKLDIPPIDAIIAAFSALRDETFYVSSPARVGDADPVTDETVNEDDAVTTSEEISTRGYALASETIMPVMSLLGVAFSFASKDLGTRVKKLKKVAEGEAMTLQEILRQDEAAGTKWVKGSNTRMIQGCYTAGAFVFKLFANLAMDESVLLYTAARDAYEEVFSGLHTWSVRQAVLLGLRSLPTKAVFMERVAGSNDEGRARIVNEKFSAAWIPLSRVLLEMVGDAP